MVWEVPRSGGQPAKGWSHTTPGLGAALVAVALLTATAGAPRAEESAHDSRPPVLAQVAQAGQSDHGTEPRELQPRYEPVPPEPEPFYDASYIFALTRGVTTSTMVAPVKALLLPLSVPLDIVLLPFAAIGGFF